MDKTTQNLIWSCLPHEYKKEVKRQYRIVINGNQYFTQCTLEFLFGHHNLTSDAEREVELLHVTRQKVMGLYANAKKIHDLYTSATCINTKESQQIDICKGVMSILDTLFGSKCLPDEDCNVASSDVASNVAGSKPKPAEPKFNYKVDDKVRVKGVNNYILCGKVGVIKKLPDKIEPFNYKIGFENDKYTYLSEEYLEPYTEPDTSHETSVCENHSDNTSQKEVNMNSNCNLLKDCDKQFDNILKDSFSKERRLNIAAMAMQGLLNATSVERFTLRISPEAIAEAAFEYADALIAESERKGGKHD